MQKMLDDYFVTHKDEMLADISSLIEIPSVRGVYKEGMPYGEEPYKALCKALSIADIYGFICSNFDGYIGTVDYNKEETELNIFAHLDVVDAGKGWNTPPFTMIEKDGMLFGRGVSDDKGPAVAALYAMKALKDCGINLSKNVRLILGTDEECGSSDLEYYFSEEKPSKWSFTPDAEFPVTNGEKGRFAKKFYAEYDCENALKYIEYIHAGVAGNAVPSECEAKVIGLTDEEINLFAADVSKKLNVSFTVKDGVILCIGMSAHASLPFEGNNPITAMVTLLSALPLDECVSRERINAVCNMFPHGDFSGRSLGIEMADMLGELTISLNILHMENGKIEGYFDARTPMKANTENCSKTAEKIFNEYGFALENIDMIPAHYVDENSQFIKVLLKNYELFTGEKGECVSMGGGTYVHNIDGGVAFGAIKKDLSTNMHGANEFMPVEDLITAAKIYASVIYDMCK